MHADQVEPSSFETATFTLLAPWGGDVTVNRVPAGFGFGSPANTMASPQFGLPNDTFTVPVMLVPMIWTLLPLESPCAFMLFTVGVLGGAAVPYVYPADGAPVFDFTPLTIT